MKDKMLINKIENGTVIDKIPAGKSLLILSALHINDDDKETVAVAIRVPSASMTQKDLMKLNNRVLNDEELKKIWLIAPDAVIAEIRDYQVDRKFRVSDHEISNEFTGVLTCNNPTCATNYNEPVNPKFIVIQREPILVRCLYCDRVMIEENIKAQL